MGVNFRLIIALVISVVAHIITLCFLKTASGISSDTSIQSNPIFTVLINTPQVKIPIAEQLPPQTQAKTEEDVTEKVISQSTASGDNSKQIHFPLPVPEPKYYALKELDSKPVMIGIIETRPPELESYHQGGEIKIQIWIDEEGNVVKSEVLNSDLPQAFIDYTIASFSQAKFEAGIKEGVPVRSVAKVVVQYVATGPGQE